MNTFLTRSLLALVIGIGIVGTVAYAQTFTEPSSPAPNSNTYAPLNTGTAAQTMAGQLWAASVGANTSFTLNPNSVWDVENNLATFHMQQLCLGNNCYTTFPTAAAGATITTGSTSCNGSWCAATEYTEGYICQQNGYSHVVDIATGGGAAGNTECSWASAQVNAFTCDTLTSATAGSDLTSVTCDDNGFTPANPVPTGGGGGGGTGGSPV